MKLILKYQMSVARITAQTCRLLTLEILTHAADLAGNLSHICFPIVFRWFIFVSV